MAKYIVNGAVLIAVWLIVGFVNHSDSVLVTAIIITVIIVGVGANMIMKRWIKRWKGR